MVQILSVLLRLSLTDISFSPSWMISVLIVLVSKSLPLKGQF